MKSSVSWLESILWSCFVFVVITYCFYFIYLPQDWALMDHYRWAIEWATPSFNPIEGWKSLMHEIMDVGRFRPLDVFSWVVRYRFLPITPRAFHIVQFPLLGISLASLAVILRRAGSTHAQIAFCLLLSASSLAVKDWIFYTSAAEPIATTLFLVSLAFYLSGKKWISLPFFVASFLTKESFFAFSGVFILIEAWEIYRTRRLSQGFPALTALILAILMIVYVRSLPQIYVQKASITSLLNIRRLATGFIMPPLKNYLPAILLVGFGIAKARRLKLSPSSIPVLIAGTSIIVIYTLLLCIWGPFDSWFYLHIPIPFGWALVLSVLWLPQSDSSNKFESALFAMMCCFFAFISLNGSRNLWTVHSEVGTVARIACEDSERVPGLQIYSNCNEGSVNLKRYLVLYHVCKSPPDFKYLNGNTTLNSEMSGPYELILGKKCDPFSIETTNAHYTLPLSQWTVLKNFQGH